MDSHHRLTARARGETMHRVLADFVASYIGVLLAVAAPTPTSPEPQATLREHTRYELSNGLTVILHPVDDVPLVRVHVRYHVGGADEPLHRRGIAHIVEHLTFEGSEHISADARARALFYIGALDDNATTSLTSTDYFLTVPSEYTEMALWLESERMGYSSATVTRENLRAVQRVVANERRERIDAEPYASLQVHLAKALYPTSHPFHSHHIGSLFDIANATPGEAREFVRDWYVPANATLVLVGDLPPVTRTWVEKYFGSLARTVAAPRPAVAAIDPGREVVVNIVEPLGKSPVVLAAWPTPALYTAEDAVADVLSEALTGGAFDRLAGRDAGSSLFSAHQRSLPVQSRFLVALSGGAGSNVDALVATLDRVLARVAHGQLSEAEIRRARERVIANSIAALQTLEGRAERLHHYAEYRNDPDWLAEDIRRYRDVTPNAVARFASVVLHRKRRVILRATPAATPAAFEERAP